MHTEDEAKNLWCPHARVLEPYAEKTSMNRDTKDESLCRCIASKCMAWRWGEKEVPADFAFAGSTDAIPGRGFCGLAGRP
jgi:hypothetical protein